MRKDEINIWPLGIIYIFMCIILVAFMLLFIIFPFGLLIRNEPMYFIDIIYIKDGYLQFLVMLPMSVFSLYIILRTGIFSFKVSFTETHIIAPRIAEIQEKKVEIECNKILTCEPTMEGFHFYFAFHCADKKKQKMSIMRFSFKQMEKILKLIQERGGLQGQDIDAIINPLRIKRRQKK